MSEQKTQGEISVTTQHIFPIIKRWLYSDKDIFLRELVSNASDAITKLVRLVSLSEATAEGEYAIRVVLDPKAGTLTVSDNGIGMTEQEVDRYLNSIALSGALEFIEKYEGEGDAQGIIGHFGLGFYSAFMVAGEVEVLTRSYTGAEAAHWSCTDAGSFVLGAGEREERGTSVILHVTEEEREYLDRERLRGILSKYCSFLAYPVLLSVVGEEGEEQINELTPLWQKNPSEVTEEEYRAFYHKLFGYSTEPLFWIHLNADYPLNFKGVLYFPRLQNQFQSMEGEVKLYYHRVFVADNVTGVIPEYLLSLKGVLDCPELPLNVSRSFLQASPYVSKLSAHIAKKVCDKLSELAKNERESYEGFARDLKPFLEYGSMRDEKFASRVRDLMLYELCGGGFVTLPEYLEGAKDKQVLYATDATRQAQYVSLLSEQSKRAVLLDTVLDSQYITYLEHRDGEEGVRFVRVDSAVEALTDGDAAGEDSALAQIFASALPAGVTVQFATLKGEQPPALLVTEEHSRRFADFMRAYQSATAEAAPLPESEEALCVNLNSPLCERVRQATGERQTLLARQIYYGALLCARAPSEEELRAFSENNAKILENA